MPLRKPFEDQEGWRPQLAPSELLKQLGYITSYSQPRFGGGGGRGGGGLGISDGIRSLQRASEEARRRQELTEDRGTMADLEGVRLQRERIEQQGVGPKEIAKNDPRGTASRIFDTMVSGAGRAAQRLGEGRFAGAAEDAEMRRAMAERQALAEMYPDPVIDPRVAAQARRQPAIAGGIADLAGQKTNFINEQSKLAQAGRPIQQASQPEILFSQLYRGELGAAGQALTRGGKGDINGLLKELANPKIAQALMGTLPLVDEVGPSGIDSLVYGDTKPGFDYKTPQDKGTLFRLVRGDNNQKWNGDEWNLEFADKEGQDTLSQFREVQKNLFAGVDGSMTAAERLQAISSGNSAAKNSGAKIDPYAVSDEFEFLAAGVPYERTSKHTQEALGTARTLYDQLFAAGRSPILVNKDGSKVIPLTESEWKGEFFKPTLDPTFEYQGQQTAAKQANLNPGEMKRLAALIGTSYDKALGPNGRMIESWMQGQLQAQGITDSRQKELIARGMPAIRQMWINEGYAEDKRPFNEIAASELSPALTRFLENEKVTTYAGMTPAQKNFAVMSDTEDEREYEREQFFGGNMGGMGGMPGEEVSPWGDESGAIGQPQQGQGQQQGPPNNRHLDLDTLLQQLSQAKPGQFQSTPPAPGRQPVPQGGNAVR